jgi:drug/metabolite transporter (DMT)-like permease
MTTSQIASAAGADLKRQVLGIGLVVFSTIAIALVPTLAKLAYEGGSNTLSVITGRSVFSVLITLLLLLVLRQPIAIPRRPLRIALCTGAGYAAILYGYLGAVNYLPVNQVILIYFMHPLLVGFVAMYRGQERFSLVSTGVLVAALIGICLHSAPHSKRRISLASDLPSPRWRSQQSSSLPMLAPWPMRQPCRLASL